MTLQLTGKNEPKGSFQEFYGRPTEKMPSLIKAGCVPISVAGVINRREHAPADVIDEWKNHYFFTGDGAIYDGRKNAKIVLDLTLLREINPNTRLDNYAAVLSDHLWDGLGGDNVLNLSSDQIKKAHKKGFVKRNGLWQPENTVIGDIWKGTDTFPGLARGRDIQSYAKMVNKASKNDRVMWFWFDRNTYSSPVMRSLVVSRFDSSSDVYGSNLLDYLYGRLAGVAPEAPNALENGSPYRNAGRSSEEVLEERLSEVLSPFDQFVGTINKSQYENLKQQALRELKGLFKEK